MSKRWNPWLLTLGITVGLTACGGGGSSGVEEPPAGVTGCASSGSYDTYTSSSGTGKTAGAAIGSCKTAGLTQVQWTQTSGPSVTLLADKTQAIEFSPTTVGNYGFTASFVDGDGVARSQPINVTVAAPSAQRLTLRGNQAVRMGGNVSIRAWPTLNSGESVQSIAWTQIEGPTVTNLNVSDNHVALFVAPTVTRDTVVRMRATMTTSSGVVDTAEAIVLVERYDSAAATDTTAIWSGDHVSRVYAYRSASPWANVMTGCVYSSALRTNNLCTLQTLPFLAQETGGAMPTVEQVMNRVLVSHDWLGRNFENFLRTQDVNGDFRRMMNSVTAVVLGVQVRPSFYYAMTGAIYLDGDNFWLTAEERDTVNEAPDFRSDFGKDLQFSTPWRYVRGNSSVFKFFDSRARVSRTVDYLMDESGWLLYHELGHALDFMPPGQYGSLNSTTSAWGNISPYYTSRQLASDILSSTYPLTSAEMSSLGQVQFQGATATDVQRSYTPLDVSNLFRADRATDDYGYSSTREDLTMVLEEFLMNRRLGIQRDFAVTNKITDTTTSSTLFVTWGQRGRVGEAAIKPRVTLAAQRLTPWMPTTEINLLPAPIPMRAGQTWSSNLVLPAPTSDVFAKPESFHDDVLARKAFRKESMRMKHYSHEGLPRMAQSLRH